MCDNKFINLVNVITFKFKITNVMANHPSIKLCKIQDSNNYISVS